MVNPSMAHQRLHDLNTVLVDFKAVTTLLKSGYKFDDQDGPAALARLDHALQLLAREITERRAETEKAESS